MSYLLLFSILFSIGFSQEKPTQDSKIAIIGSGVSGTFLAHHLQTQGYSDITVFERENRSAHICDTYWVADKPYDLSIVYAGVQPVPHAAWFWKVLNPLKFIVSPLLALYAKYFPEPILYHSPFGHAQVTTNDYNKHINNIQIHPRATTPLPLHRFNDTPILVGIRDNPDKVVTELIAVWELIEDWTADAEVGVEKCLRKRIAEPIEKFGEWVDRNSLGYTGAYMAYMFDFFGNPSTMSAPACQVIAGSMLKWQGAIPFFLLAALQASLKSATRVPPLLMVKAIIGLQHNSILWQFDEGYCEVFKRTQKSTQAKFHFEEEVTSVKNLGPQNIELTTRKGKYHFNEVIFAIRPQDFEPLGIPGFERFHRVAYQVQLIKATGKINASDIIVPREVPALQMLSATDPTFGTRQVDLTGRLGGFVAEWPWVAPDVLVLIGNGEKPEDFGKNFEKDLQKQMEFGFAKLYFSRIYTQGPNYVANKYKLKEFGEWVASKQGKDNIYYLGEYLAGHGVPENFQFSKQFVEKYFPLIKPVSPTYPTYPAPTERERHRIRYIPEHLGQYCQTGEPFELSILQLVVLGFVYFGMFGSAALCARRAIRPKKIKST